MKIGKFNIKNNGRCFIIAEAGINHNGNINIAKQLVDIAVNKKCDAVKFQTFKESEIKGLHNITYDETEEIKEYCDKKGIMFLSTPHSISAIDFLEDLVPAYKIASPHITNDDFIKKVIEKGKPLIASTGSIVTTSRMSSFADVNHLLSITPQDQIALLYCVSKYPCNDFDFERFGNFFYLYDYIPIGFSCHSLNLDYSLQAIKRGACIVEKHITIDKNYECPDNNVSLDPTELEQLVNRIREIEKMRK